MTIRQSWRRRRKVGLAIRSPRNCGRDFHPLAINRRTNQDQNQYRRQNCKYTSRIRCSFHLTSQFRAIVIDPSGTRQDSLIDESNVSTTRSPLQARGPVWSTDADGDEFALCDGLPRSDVSALDRECHCVVSIDGDRGGHACQPSPPTVQSRANGLGSVIASGRASVSGVRSLVFSRGASAPRLRFSAATKD